MPSHCSVTDKCFFDIEIAGRKLGQLIFKLHTNVCPKTCENFRCLCTGEEGYSDRINKALHYKNSTFHRVVKGFMIQGGDFTNGDGKGGESIYGGPFRDENFTLKHDKPYLLSMANRGKDTNKSQFFITTSPAPHLDGIHVVFGTLISGFDLVNDIENQSVDSKFRPINKIHIVNCGEIKQEQTSHDGSTRRGKIEDVIPKKRLLPRQYSSCRASVSLSENDTSPRSSKSSSDSSSSSSSSSSSNSSSQSSSSASSSSESSSSSSNSDSNSSEDDSSSSSDSHPCDSSSYMSNSSSSSALAQKKSKRGKNRTSRRRKEVELNKINNEAEDDVVLIESVETETLKDEREYPCSVRPDDIPKIPMNKFLFRSEPSQSTDVRTHDLEDDEPLEMNQDLSRYQDRDSEEEEQIGKKNSRSVSSAVSTVEKYTRVSRSGRTMKGRGSFKFRTPSPDSRRSRSKFDERRRRSRSPYQDRHKDNSWRSNHPNR